MGAAGALGGHPRAEGAAQDGGAPRRAPRFVRRPCGGGAGLRQRPLGGFGRRVGVTPGSIWAFYAPPDKGTPSHTC